jgi:hypothetical protein
VIQLTRRGTRHEIREMLEGLDDSEDSKLEPPKATRPQLAA